MLSPKRVLAADTLLSTGFAHASQGHIHPKIDVRLSEEVRVWTIARSRGEEFNVAQANSTLNNDCPSAGGGTEEMNTWLHQFVPPIIKRLTKAAPGVNLSEEDVFSLMAMCPFESMAKARVDLIQGLKESGTYEGNSFLAKQKARSPFCNLFTKDEWRAFEFHGDVEKYYKTGWDLLQLSLVVCIADHVRCVPFTGLETRSDLCRASGIQTSCSRD